MIEWSRAPSIACTAFHAVAGSEAAGELDGDADGPLDGDPSGDGAVARGDAVGLGAAGDVRGLAVGVDEQAHANSETQATRPRSFIDSRRTPHRTRLLLDQIRLPAASG